MAAIQGYRQALIDGLRNTEMMKDAIALKLQYREKIQAGLRGDSVQLGASAFADLLDQWQPIGRSEAGLVELAGSGKKSDKGVVYRFDSGMGGIQFDVLTKDGVIWSVVPRGIE